MTKKDERFINGATIVLKDRPVKWAKVYEPDCPPWGGSYWTIQVVLDKDLQKELEGVGMTTKVDKDGDVCIQVKRATTTKEGKKLSPPGIFDKEGNPTTELIGNGSICNIEIYAKYTVVTGKTYLTPKLNRIRILDLVKFEQVNDLF